MKRELVFLMLFAAVVSRAASVSAAGPALDALIKEAGAPGAVKTPESHPFGPRLTLRMPAVAVPEAHAGAAKGFDQETQSVAGRVNGWFSPPITVLAPFGGSKISALKELNADDLVIVSWERPGDIKDIKTSFGKDRPKLTGILTKALTGGAMSTDDVDDVPVAAQILGRLHLELGVSQVQVSYYALKSAGVTSLKPWSGAPVSNGDAPLLMRFSFTLNGRSKEIVFISYSISSDQTTGRTALPIEALKLVSPSGFDWGYLSADGLGLFSLNKKNGLQVATAEFIDQVNPAGGVILDYPNAEYTRTAQEGGGMIFMQGRSPLEDYGIFKLLRDIPVTAPVFGYAGFTEGDSVRIYQKRPEMDGGTTGGGLDFTGFHQVQETVNVDLGD